MALKAVQYPGTRFPFSRKLNGKQNSWKTEDSECVTRCAAGRQTALLYKGNVDHEAPASPREMGTQRRTEMEPSPGQRNTPRRQRHRTAARGSPGRRPHPSLLSSGERHLSAAPPQPATRRRGEDRHGGGACAAGPRPGGRTSAGFSHRRKAALLSPRGVLPAPTQRRGRVRRWRLRPATPRHHMAAELRPRLAPPPRS